MEHTQRTSKPASQKREHYIVSRILADGVMLETVYNSVDGKTRFAAWDGNTWRLEDVHTVTKGKRFLPFPASNNLIRNDVVLLPSQPCDYETEQELINELQAFIHKYVDVTADFEVIATYYVLLTWLYDDFNELPYLRLKGTFGSGKTRFLVTVGSLCYKPVLASGASTISPIFHILDRFRGTLVIDEADFRFSDEKADIVKILNNGNVKGFPVLRSESSPGAQEYNPRAFNVFGPKLVATRSSYEDPALESRFITEIMGTRPLRSDIPINLPQALWEEARDIRNKLLVFRFRNHGKHLPLEQLIDSGIEPRLNQIFTPLLSIVPDAKARGQLKRIARQHQLDLLLDRSMDLEAHLLEVIHELLRDKKQTPSVKAITERFTDRFGEDYERMISPKWIGTMIRKRLHVRTQKSHGVFIIPLTERPKLRHLFERYGITREAKNADGQ